VSCHFCYNAHVWAREPHNEEDYFDEGLHDKNDMSTATIGNKTDGFQLFLNSGGGEATNIEICQWKENGYRGQPGWSTIGIYYPKFCPECGRKLDEYIINERGTKFIRKQEEI
jgi:hypothetical protein